MVFSTFDDAFGTWSPAAAVSNAADRALQPALASDELGNVHAVWQQRAATADKYQTWYANFNGTAWNAPKKISLNDAEAAEEATIEVDSRGYLWVVHNNDGTGAGKRIPVRHQEHGRGHHVVYDCRYDLLRSGTLGSSIEVGRTALAAGPDGKLVAVWDNSLTGTMARREVFVSQYDGSAWQRWVMMSDTSTVDRDHNRYVSAAVGPAGEHLCVPHARCDLRLRSPSAEAPHAQESLGGPVGPSRGGGPGNRHDQLPCQQRCVRQ